jgi:hypothetical protein
MKQRLAAKEKRELAARMKLDGHTLAEIAEACGYKSTGSASQAITAYWRLGPPQDVEDKRDLERARLERSRLELRILFVHLSQLLEKTHVIVQHGKVVGRFAGWATDPEDPQTVLRDGEGKPVATYEEIEDDDPAIRLLAEMRQNILAQLKVGEALRRLDGLDKPVVIKIEDDDGLDQEIEELVAQLNSTRLVMPPGHPEQKELER